MDRSNSAPLRIAFVAPPFLPVPPPRYGGTERIVGVLANGLHHRGHDVTVFASGDSQVEGRLVPIVTESLWNSGKRQETASLMARISEEVERRAHDFDVISSHIEWYGFDLARKSQIPVITTLHGRIDIGPTAELIGGFPDIRLVAISDEQRSYWPEQNWVATIHHGLPLDDMPEGNGSGGYLLFVGRITPEKGLDAAVELATRAKLHLVVAAKAIDPHEIATYKRYVEPAERAGVATFLGEVGPPARDRLFGDALATVMLGNWPEPFGLVAIESMATGTPVIARRAGALPEIIRHGENGFLIDDLGEADLAVREAGKLDRAAIRADVLDRFSVDRMVDEYEEVYRSLARRRSRGANDSGSEWTPPLPAESPVGG
jgi:glycosyltransferase involved in cell wall biosynthesis